MAKGYFSPWRYSPQWASASSLPSLHDHTQTHHSWLLWTSDQPDAETSTWQHTTITKRQTSMSPAGLQLTTPASQLPQPLALDRAATGIGNTKLDYVWNVMAHAQKPDFVFRWNGRVHLNRRGRQFSRLLAAEVWASAVVMLDTPCSEVVWRVLATHSIRQFPLHPPPQPRALPCDTTFQLDSTTVVYRAIWVSTHKTLCQQSVCT
jgi:hypothetical protein